MIDQLELDRATTSTRVVDLIAAADGSASHGRDAHPSRGADVIDLRRDDHADDPLDLSAPAVERRAVADLVVAAAAGDSRAWEALVARYSGLVWSIARAHRLNAADAADVSQVVWLRLVEHLDRIYRPASVGTWLASVTRNECLRVIRKAGREVPTESSVEFDRRSKSDDVDLSLLADEREVALQAACERLPTPWRSLMRVLMTEPRPSYEEIAAALDIPMGSIGPTRQRCLERLRTSPELRAVSDQW